MMRLYQLAGLLLLSVVCCWASDKERFTRPESQCPEQQKDGQSKLCKLLEQFKDKEHHCVEIEKVQCSEGTYVAEGSVCVYKTEEVVFTCKSGQWTVKEKPVPKGRNRRGWWWWGRRTRVVYKTEYVTNKPPVIRGCPTGGFQVTAPKGKTTAVASWRAPTASDPEGKGVSVEIIYGKEPGSEFPSGETIVVYRARDSGGASEYCFFPVKVKVLRCLPKPRYIQHGTYSCSNPSDENLYGSVCTYRCDSGYEIGGGASATTECLQSQKWDHSPPTCTPVSCGAPSAVADGNLNCPSGNVFPELCYVVCEPGYRQPSGAPFMRCTETRSWTTANDCVDVEAPVLINGCPPSMTLVSGPLEAPVPLNWTDPAVSDSSNYTLTSSMAKGTLIGPGVQVIRITARDAVGNSRSCDFVVSVEAKACSYPQLSSNSRLSCTHGYVEGSQCTVTCDPGYTVQGNSTLTCLDSENWDSAVPTCDAVSCGPPPTVEFGSFIGNSFHYPAVNNLVCEPNFDLQGATYIECQDDGTWSTPGKCVDNYPPTFPSGCPGNVEVYAARLGQPTAAHWTAPPVDDNSGKNVTLHSSPVSGSVFSPGVTSVTYTATDYRGNSRSCSFSVTVTTLTCPSLIMHYNSSNYLRYTCPDKNVYGAMCTTFCTNGFPKTGADNVTCDVVTNATYPPTMDWQWDPSSSQPECIETKCPKLPGPKFGAIACYQGNFAKECTMTCEASRDVPSSFDGFFRCPNNVGIWNPPNVPDCIAFHLPGQQRMLLHMYYYTGSCPASVNDIKQNFIQIVNNIWSSACSSTPSCVPQNIEVTCGATRRKRSTLPSMERCLTRNQGNVQLCQFLRRLRRRRNAMPYYIKGSVTLDISNCNDGAADPEDALNKCKAVMTNVYTLFGDKADSGELNIGTEYNTSRQLITFPKIMADCQPGTVFVNTATTKRLSCVGCSKGNFVAIGATQCEECPVGTYTELDNATACTSCAPGWSTATNGSTSSSDCQEMCQPGHYSDDGFIPCQPCPPGQFQANSRATSCDLCPASTWTRGEASNLQECVSADAHLSNNTRLIAQSSISLSTLTLVSHVLLVDVAAGNVTFTFAGKSFNPVSVYLYTHSNLTSYVPQNSSVSVSLRADSNKWLKLVLTADPSSGRTNVQLGNSSVFTGTATPTASVPPTDVKVSAIEGKVLVSGLFGKEGLDNMATPSTDCNGDSSTNLLTWTLPSTSLQFPSTCDAVDECQSSPCSSHGVCVNQQGGYLCQCQDGWNGPTCHLPPDACYQHQCRNGATCIPQGSNYTCDCKEKFSGTYCELIKVNGGFSDWSVWSNCSSPCDGEQSRHRLCNNPKPLNNGDICTGDFIQYQPCGSTSCPVDGQWSAWTQWSACSATCGIGTVRTRQRVCNNPAPKFGGDPCDGVSEETVACPTNKCKVDGVWSAWAQWSDCSSSCGGGNRLRQRSCDNPAPQFGGKLCSGISMEASTCNTHRCPECSQLPSAPTLKIDCDDTSYPLPDPVTCNVTCAPGLVTSQAFPQYRCGPSTGYLWNDQVNSSSSVILPECSTPSTATAVSISQCVSLQAGCDVDQNAVLSAVEDNLSQLPCVADGCQISASTQCRDGCNGSQRRRRRSAGILTVDTSLKMALGNSSTAFNTSDLSSSQQYVHLLTVADESAKLLIQNQSAAASPFTVTVNGRVIEPDLTSVAYTTAMQCPAGRTGISVYCVDCPKGTMEENGQCVMCPVGQYQDQPGSTSCKACPDGVSWDLPGATDIAQCVFPAPAPKPVDTSFATDDSGNKGLTIGLAVGLVAGAGIAAVVVAVLVYMKKNPASKLFRYKRPLSAMSAQVHPEPETPSDRPVALSDMKVDGRFQSPPPLSSKMVWN